MIKLDIYFRMQSSFTQQVKIGYRNASTRIKLDDAMCASLLNRMKETLPLLPSHSGARDTPRKMNDWWHLSTKPICRRHDRVLSVCVGTVVEIFLSRIKWRVLPWCLLNKTFFSFTIMKKCLKKTELSFVRLIWDYSYKNIYLCKILLNLKI